MFINKKTNAFIILILYILIDFIEIIKKKNKYNDGKKFIDKCLNDTNIKNYNIAYQFPLLSIIIPAFNCEKTIQFPISSIQNQNISTFEIILINDFSQDNTSKILQIFQKHDKRVKIINNKKNMGTLYSRCIGTLIAKGEYIFPLDNDDMVFGEDIFDYTIKKAKENNYDIIGFKAVRTKNYSENIIKMKDLYYYSFPNNLVVYQPELSTWILSLNGKFSPHDITLWGKIIKSKVYIKAINLLGVRRYSKFISWAEDTSMNFIIFNIAETYKFIYKYGILHLSSSFTASSTQPINNNFFGLLFWLEIIFDFSKNNENKNYSAQAALYITKIYFKYKSIINK
jgi:glycosyltransferase involved in cell wall biosynthesis